MNHLLNNYFLLSMSSRENEEIMKKIILKLVNPEDPP